jgi:putative ABC transport system permease protein
VRLYQWLLWLYPRRVRTRFAAEMRLAFAEDYARERARGLAPGLRFLLVTVLQTGVAALAERLPRMASIRSFLSTDVRDATRALRSTPLVTTAAVLSLALGIGANTALFSILHSLVFKPLPVAEPERLALLAGNGWTNPIWEQIRDRQSDLFDGAFAWSRERFNLAAAGPADPVEGGYVSGGMFRTLGIGAAIGRPLTEDDDVRGGGWHGYGVVVSHRFWQRRLGGGFDVLGRRLTVNGVPFTVVGVAPREFLGPEVGQGMDLFLPLSSEAAIRGPESALDGRSSWWLEVMVRLRDGQSFDAAALALNGVRGAIRESTVPLDASAERRAQFLSEPFMLVPAATGVSPLRDRFAQPLTIIMCVVASVLAIACANIANLMLARAASRRHEMSVRLALGASRTRLRCQLLVESLLLATAGAAAGLALARAGAALLVAQLASGPGGVTLDLSTDWRVLGFTAMTAAAATLLFGLAPALGLSQVAPNDVLREQGRAVIGDRRFGLRSALVVAQVALSFTLVASAGLFLRTFTTLVTFPLGFDPEQLLIINMDARQSGIPPEERAVSFQRVADAVASAPGVRRASLSFLTPMSGRGWNGRVQVEGGPVLSGRDQVTWLNAVAPGWFQTYGMRLLAGRDFAPSDVSGGEPVVVVNETFVRRFVGSQSPIGARVKGTTPNLTHEMVIVGVVNDAVYRSVRAGVVPTMYLPMTQGGPFGAGFSVTARVEGERPFVEHGIAEAVRRTDPKLTLAFRDYSDQVRATILQDRLLAMLAGFFGGLSMLLAAIGLYGVTSYSANRRRPELALRLALGASAPGVVRLVLSRVVVLMLLGTAFGCALVLWTGTFIGTLLFQVEATDPMMLAAAAAVLMGVGLLAGWLPARSVSRLDPAAALRQ